MLDDIFDEINRMRKEMNKVFDRFSKNTAFKNFKEISSMKTPPLDMQETDDSMIVKLDMPGVDKKDVQIHVKDHLLEVKAHKKREAKTIREGYYKQERAFSGFYRALQLPATVDSENTEVDYKDGVLKITIPKKEKAKEKARKIRIRSK